ncbi:MAG: S8 family serine peptidase [Solirubrobacteraceae bacterium]
MEGAHETSVIQRDLSLFDTRFRLPAIDLDVGPPGAPPVPDSLARPEEVLDVEMIHAIAPGARVRVVPIEGTSDADGVNAEEVALREAVNDKLGQVVSLSVASAERCTAESQAAALTRTLREAKEDAITVVAASGDFGAVAQPCGLLRPEPRRGVSLPASSPLALAVGGTRLLTGSSGEYAGETAWFVPSRVEDGERLTFSNGSGGGFSTLFLRPSYQDGVSSIGRMRGVPDVSADADGGTGLALVAELGGREAVFSLAGTSSAAPLWAGVAALADQYAGRSLGFINPILYGIAKGPLYQSSFNDVTRGGNTTTLGSGRVLGFDAGPGWDPVTGWGSPKISVLVPLLAQDVHAADGKLL